MFLHVAKNYRTSSINHNNASAAFSVCGDLLHFVAVSRCIYFCLSVYLFSEPVKQLFDILKDEQHFGCSLCACGDLFYLVAVSYCVYYLSV